MPVSFEQPGAFSPSISYGYGALTQEMADRDFALRARAHMGGGGGGGTQVQMYNPGGGNVQGMGGGGHGGGTDYESLVNSTLAIRQGELSQAESIRLQRDKNSLAQLDQAYNDGQIPQETYQNARIRLLTGIDPYERRQAAAHVAAMEQQNKMVAESYAQQVALRGRSMQDRQFHVYDADLMQQVLDDQGEALSDQAEDINHFHNLAQQEVTRLGGRHTYLDNGEGHAPTRVSENQPTRTERTDQMARVRESERQHWLKRAEEIAKMVHGNGGTQAAWGADRLQTRMLPPLDGQAGAPSRRPETHEEAVRRLLKEETGASTLDELRDNNDQRESRPFSSSTPVTRLNGHQRRVVATAQSDITDFNALNPQPRHQTQLRDLVNEGLRIFRSEGSMLNLAENHPAFERYKAIQRRVRDMIQRQKDFNTREYGSVPANPPPQQVAPEQPYRGPSGLPGEFAAPGV